MACGVATVTGRQLAVAAVRLTADARTDADCALVSELLADADAGTLMDAVAELALLFTGVVTAGQWNVDHLLHRLGLKAAIEAMGTAE